MRNGGLVGSYNTALFADTHFCILILGGLIVLFFNDDDGDEGMNNEGVVSLRRVSRAAGFILAVGGGGDFVGCDGSRSCGIELLKNSLAWCDDRRGAAFEGPGGLMVALDV